LIVESQITVPVILYGKITNNQSIPLSNVHVIDLNTRTGTITSSDGLYRLPVYAKDTVRFSSVGYKTTLLIMAGTADQVLLANFQLITDTLNLTEIVIRPYPKDLQTLKREFLSLELTEEPKVDLHMDEIEIQGPVNSGMVISGPFTALYEAFSRHAKIMRKYESLIRQDNLKLLVSKRYNMDIVQKITGLKDEQEVLEFMEFCNLEPEFILRVNDYDLFCAVNDCLKKFMTQKE
jgi:hypothetical protein